MNPRELRVIVLTLFVAGAPLTARAGESDCLAEQGIVQLRAGQSINAFHARFETQTIEAYPAQNLYLITLPPNVNEDEFEAFVEVDPAVLWADRNCFVTDTLLDGSTRSIFFSSIPSAYENPMMLSVIGSPAHPRSPLGGHPIIAILDTGIGAHPRLATRLLPGLSVLAAGGSAMDTGDGLDNDGDGWVDEMVGHGTMIAGLAARLAPRAQLLPVQVMDDEGIATTFSLTVGVYEAVAAGAHVLNVSMGQVLPADVLLEAIEHAAAHGAIVVASAGNDDRPEPQRWPAAYDVPNVLAVAATTVADERSLYSSYGAHVDLSAPGDELTSTMPDGSFALSSGTSYATPLVTGTVAAMLGQNLGLSVETQRRILLDTAAPIDGLNPGFEGLLGRGRLRAALAVQRARLSVLAPVWTIINY